MKISRQLLGLWAAIALGTLAGCIAPNETLQPPSNPVVVASVPPMPTLGAATPNGTISIACFLAFHEMVDKLAHLDAQTAAFPPSAQGDVLRSYADRTRNIVAAAPAACFTADELDAFDAFWRYAESTASGKWTRSAVLDLIMAIGIPYPTSAP